MENTKLENLPNIGTNLAKKLRQAEINTSTELEYLGAKNTFIKLKTIDSSVCINTLYALQGAIERIRWHNLSNEQKSELKEFFNSLKTF